MSNSDQTEPGTEPTPEGPELDLLRYDDEGIVKFFEPESFGAYIVVDEFNVVELCEAV